jgi:Domain of unknown function (DUF4145)
MAEEPKRKLYCNRCRRDTNHNIRASYISSSYDDDSEVGESEENLLCECAGCEAATLLIKYSSTAFEEEMVSSYPERKAEWRSQKFFVNIPRKLRQTYKETVDAYNRESLLLCTLGLRALIEGVCDDKQAKGKTLEEKIDALGEHFGKTNITSYLHGFRFSGNEAAHQLEPLSKEDCSQAITVMEDLMNYLYDLDYKASRMKHAQRTAPPAATPAVNPTGTLPQP